MADMGLRVRAGTGTCVERNVVSASVCSVLVYGSAFEEIRVRRAFPALMVIGPTYMQMTNMRHLNCQND